MINEIVHLLYSGLSQSIKYFFAGNEKKLNLLSLSQFLIIDLRWSFLFSEAKIIVEKNSGHINGN